MSQERYIKRVLQRFQMEISIVRELWLGILDCKSVYHNKFVLFVDSQSSIQLDKNPTFHNRSKHIDVWFH